MLGDLFGIVAVQVVEIQDLGEFEHGMAQIRPSWAEWRIRHCSGQQRGAAVCLLGWVK